MGLARSSGSELRFAKYSYNRRSLFPGGEFDDQSRDSLVVVVIALLGGPIERLVAQHDELVRDEDVKLATFDELKYPFAARVPHIQGVVVVRARLDDQGRVTDSVAISGAKELIPDSVANSKKWRFQPNPQKSAVIVYDFRIDSGLCYGGYVSSQFVIHPPNLATIRSCEAVAEH